MTAKQEAVLQALQGKTAAVVGIGLRSGVPLIRFLLQQGCRVVACDRKERQQLPDVMEALAGLPIEFQLGDGYLQGLERCQFIFRTPGMRPDLPELTNAVRAGAKLTSEIELVFALAEAPINGITGSDGKTTTTTLVSEMLRADGREVYLGGNIGHSLIEEVLDIPASAEIVLELSSFQLMGMQTSPQAAIVTNLSPNHLDYHLSLDEYVAAKEQIFLHQRAEDLAVFNLDNETTRLQAQRAPGRVLCFSRRQPVERGAFLRDHQIVLRVGDADEILCSIEEVRLPGWHNVENLLAAAALARARGASLAALRHVATTFSGVEHRLELVRELAGVRYYNDSIASSPSRTIAGIQSFRDPLVLILGGYDKQIPFEPLAEAVVGRVDAVALIGQTAAKIESAIRTEQERRQIAGPVMQRCDSLETALDWCRAQARPGSAVLLSPACASFDMFQDFEARGNEFKKLVAALR